jgi:hypothetical protein
MVLGCLASWAVYVLFQWDALPFYLIHILAWFLSDWILLSVVQVMITFGRHKKLIFDEFLIAFIRRTAHYRLINSILSSDGYSENSPDHIYFYVHYQIQRYDGVSEPSNCTGVALHMRQNRA